MKENSIEETIKQLKLMLKVRKGQKEIIECAGGSCINCDPDIKALSESIDILSDYKRVLKENEELKQDRNNNYQMIALAQNEALGYMQGYEDGKKLKRSAVANIVENQQYYIIKKQIEKYEEHMEKLQKENKELKESNEILNDAYWNECITKQTIKDKIEEILNNNEYRIVFEGDAEFPDEATTIKAQEYIKLDVLQELLEGRE